jgi:hypothetical protein
MPPLLAIEFMVRCAEIFVEYFGDCRERTLRAYFVTVYQLLEEMCDSGMPLVTETSILKEIIVPPSLMNRMTSAVQVVTPAPRWPLAHLSFGASFVAQRIQQQHPHSETWRCTWSVTTPLCLSDQLLRA